MKILGVVLMASALVMTGSAAATNAVPARTEALAREADAFFKDQQPGGVVLVTQGDQVLLRRAYGMADIENGVAMRPDAALRLASVTKQFTAVAVMQLVQAGKLRLDTPLDTLDPALAGPMGKVTVQQLLTHTSGIKNVSSIPASRAARREETDALGLIGYFKDLPLEFASGTRFRYSNSNYIVLTHLIQRLSGQPYAEYMQQAIFQPLGMQHTRYDTHLAIIPGRAHGYRKAQGVLQNADFISMTQPQGAGGLVSTVDDLAIWHRALRDGTLVPAALLAQAMSKTVLSDGKASPYGFGWIIGQVQGVADVEHGGFINGFNSYVVQLKSPDVAAIAADVPYAATVALSDKDASWLGRYVLADDDVRVLSLVDGRLQLLRQGEGEEPVAVNPGTDGRYYLAGGLDALSFATADDGRAVMTLHDRLMGDTHGYRTPTVAASVTGSAHP